MTRAISSVLDVAVFLLLVSAAVATLTLAPDDEPGSVVVDDRANVLGSATADVEYAHRGERRRAHGTVAALLARGAVANATIDGRPFAARNDAFVERVRAEARTALGPRNRTQVLVRWVPYRGSPVRGTLRVGRDPPPNRDVTVATLSIPAPVPSGDEAASRARTDGFEGVANLTARATVEPLLPADRATLPSGRVSPASAVASSRLRTLADATDASVEGPLSRGNVSTARERAVEGLTDRFAADMRDRFESPEEAATAVRVDTVEIALRRWEA